MAKEAYLFMLEAFDTFNINPDAGTYLPFDRFFVPCEVATASSVVLGVDNTEPGLTANVEEITGSVGSYVLDQHTICVNLERSSLFNLAGVPVNNSRVLALHAKLRAGGVTYQQSATLSPGEDTGEGLFSTVVSSDVINANNGDRSLFIFLKYVKLARVFLNNVEVEQ